MWSVSDNLLRVHVMGSRTPVACCGSGNEFWGIHYNKSSSVFAFIHDRDDTHRHAKKKNSNCIFPSPILASSSYYSRNMRLRLVRRAVCGRFDSQFRPAETDLSPQAGG